MSKRRYFTSHKQEQIGEYAGCMNCNTDTNDPDPMKRPHITGEGEVFCPSCKQFTNPETYEVDEEADAKREEREITECFYDIRHLNIKPGGGGSNGNSRSKKVQGISMQIRDEQEPMMYHNGNDGRATITSIDLSSERLQVTMPKIVKEGLDATAKARPVPSSVVIREALDACLGRCVGTIWEPGTPMTKKDFWVTPGDFRIIKNKAESMTAKFKRDGVKPCRVTPSQLASECVSSFLGFKVEDAKSDPDPD